ncbi:MAG: ATP-binding cassette domain-containing protein [Alphaproteobacteria bacterium]|nr:ATP-binding cassette domain-containing protein [Alphaproteobacteria bacterium]
MLKMKNIRVRNILIDLNLEVSDGEFVVIIGENGAGKSTLFNTISGYIIPEFGNIYINGEEVTTKTQYERAYLVANVFQDPKVGTISGMSIRDNLNIAYRRGMSREIFRNSSSKNRDSFFQEKLGELEMGLEKRLDCDTTDLSGGQRQALSIVMSFLADSKILLLDEITAALDLVNSKKIVDLVTRKCAETKKTCLMITHNQEQIYQSENRILSIKDGNIKHVN